MDFHTDLSSLSVLESVPLGVNPVAYIRAASPLPFNAEILIEDQITEVALDRLVVVKDFYARGLTTNLPDWLGTLNIKWQKRSRSGNPIFSMLPDVTVRREDSKLDMGLDSLPVYCISSNFTLHPRLFAEWERAVRNGNANASLDVTMVGDHVRRVNEAMEVATIQGPPITIDGVTPAGLLDTPNKFEFGGHVSWTATGKTGPQIYADVSGMIEQAQSLGHYGPFVLYVGTKYGRALGLDYVTTMANTKTVRARILEDEQILDIKTADRIPDDNILLVEPLKNNFDMVVGQQPTVISWLEGPAALAIRRYIVIACVFLRVREDFLGNNGIIHGLPTK